MKVRTLRHSLFACLLALTAGSVPSAPVDGTAPLDLRAAAPSFTDTGAGLAPAIDGFGRTSTSGTPGLPIRILMVAIPEGATPVLRLGPVVTRRLEDLDIAPVPDTTWRDRGAEVEIEQAFGSAERRGPHAAPVVDYRRDAGAYGRDAWTPAAPLRLGRIGWMRDQRFVEVIYQPLLYNPARRQALFHERIEAEVRFEAPVEPDRGMVGQKAHDARFESAYARAFVNYAQGRAFRRRAVHPGDVETAAAGRTGIESAAVAPAAGGTQRYKLSVTQAGLYRLDQAWLTANAADLAGVDPRTLSIAVDGAEVPIAILDAAGGNGESDAVFGAGDSLLFYGGPKIEPPTEFNLDPNDHPGGGIPLIYELNDFTDTQVYWLESGGAPGSHARMAAAAAAPLSGYALAVDFPETALWDENNLFWPIGAGDPYISFPSLLAGSVPQRDLSIPLPGLAPGAASATVTVVMRGGSTLAVPLDDHRTKFWVNADLVNVADYTWDGEIDREQPLTLPQTSLSNPVTVHLQAPGQAGVSIDRQYPQTINVAYRRTFAASGQALLFHYPNQNARFTVTSLTSTAPVILEISRTLANGEPQALRLTGATPGGAPTTTWTFEVAQDVAPGAPATRTFLVAGPSGARTPDAVAVAPAPSLAVAGQSADMLVIAAPTTIDASPGGALDLLLAHRFSAQGLTSRVIDITRIYEEFSGGRRDANAVRAFLTYAFANWRGPAGTDPPPTYVLLVGDASLDFKNTLQRGDWVDQVPTPIMVQYSNIIGYYSSDNWLASCNGPDQIPDMLIGRISTRNATASAQVFDKIRMAEITPPAGAWKGHATLTSGDWRNPGEEVDFQNVNEALRQAYFDTAPYTTPTPPLYFTMPPWDNTDAGAVAFNLALKNEFQAGAGVLTYVGHGAFDVWGLKTLFTTADAAGLTNGQRLPFVMISNCLSGGFHFLLGSGAIAEALVNNPNGGAIAVFAPSGLSNAFIGMLVAPTLFEPLYGRSRDRELGPATLPVRVALSGQNSFVDLQSYTFMGDPASLGPTPAPEAPSALVATAGNGQVTLSWTAPAVPTASTAIYRVATNPAGNYQLIACTPAGPTSCVDDTAVNLTRYYYAAVSVDAEGFAGAWSNLNQDCDAGPGCVTARPSNSNPPAAPTGIVVSDPGSGDRLTVSWNASPEEDLKRYNVRYGTTIGVYPSTLAVTPPAVTASLQGLQNGTRYYIVVTATNTADLESPPSVEQSGVPHLFEGIAPARAISDLKLTRAGADLILTWSRPTLDIYGRATTVTGYRIYRGGTPNYVPIGSAPLVTLNNGATTTWTHTGGANLAGNSFYFVTALDTAGLESGAGHDLPNGVGDLVVTLPDPLTAPSSVHLAWSPVTSDVQGIPTLVHYQIHSTATPVGRLGLGPGTLLLDNVTGTSVDLTIAANPRYLSVLAVDTRGNLSPY